MSDSSSNDARENHSPESPDALEEAPGSNGQAGAAGAGPEQEGPDPVIGAGIVLLGIFVMGTAGALNAHYAFDLGVFLAVGGAALFVLFITLSALKQRRQNLSS